MQTTPYAEADFPQPLLTDAQRDVPELKWVDSMSQLLDTKFRVPGTQQRFGVDFLLGLVPGAGDLISMGFSGVLVATMAKHGASGKLVGKMLLNVLLDATVGAVPVLGNVFDFFYKANARNALLMREYYDEGKHGGSVWPVVLGVAVAMLAMFGLVIYVVYAVLAFVAGLF